MVNSGRHQRLQSLHRIYRKVPAPLRNPVWSMVRRFQPHLILEVYGQSLTTSERTTFEYELQATAPARAVHRGSESLVNEPSILSDASSADALALLTRSVARIERIVEASRPRPGLIPATPPRRADAETSQGDARLVWDIRAAQNPTNGERGIARYVFEQAVAYAAAHPDAVESFAVNGSLPVPGKLWPLVDGGRVAHLDEVLERVNASETWLWYLTSPIELDYSTRQLLPNEFRRDAHRVAVTCFDLIPELYSEVYLRDRHVRANYRSHLELIRQADRVLCISESCARDVARLLELPADRIAVIGAGVSGDFRPDTTATADSSARRRVRESFPKIPEGFVLFPGGMDTRKNFERTIAAYGRIDPKLRAQHHLVYVCSVNSDERAQLRVLTDRAGVTSTFHVLGFVPDDLLVALYQTARLVWFPSIYEGFGLPVVEALACHTPVLCADSSSLVELLPDPEHRFDPLSVDRMAVALERGIRTPPEFSATEFDALVAPHRWTEVARRTHEVLAELGSESVRALATVSARPTLAYITPWPPARSGVAGYSRRLIEALRAHADVTVLSPAPGPGAEDIESFDTLEAAHGAFDSVVVAIGNSDHHVAILEFLRRHPKRCVVHAHDIRLLGLYTCWLAGLGPNCEHEQQRLLTSLYGSSYAALVEQLQPINHLSAQRLGHWWFREVGDLARLIVVHSQFASTVVRLECPGAHVEVVPLAIPIAPEASTEALLGRRAGPLVVSMGVVSDTKDVVALLRAFEIVQAENSSAALALVGPGRIAETSAAKLPELAKLRRSGALIETGDVSDDVYWAWLRAADVAVQLRATTNAEASAAIGDAMAAGVPLIFTDNGPNRALPPDVGVRVPPHPDPVMLARILSDLLRDKLHRDRLRTAAQSFARATGFPEVASMIAGAVLPSGFISSRNRVTSPASIRGRSEGY